MYVCCIAWPTSRSHRPLYLTIALNCLTTRKDHPFHQQTRHPPRGGYPRLGNCGRKVERKGRWVAERGGTAGLTGLTLPTRPDLRPQSRRASTPWRGPVSSGGPHLQRPWSPPQSRLSQHPRCVTNHQRHARMNELKVDGVGMRCCKVGNSCF
jgi:hypothetical protein